MWGERITASGSPAQLKGVIATLGELLDSRVKAISQQYERTVTQGGNPAKVDPKNIEVLNRLRSGGASGTNARGWKLMTDASGNKAYVSPDGKQFEEVK